MSNEKRGPVAILRWITRRLALPTLVAAVVGRSAFTIAQVGFAGFEGVFTDWQDAAYTLVMVFVTVAAVTITAMGLARTALHGALRAMVLFVVGAIAAWALVYFLTDVIAYANLAIVPAIATTIVWILCNLDVLKRKKENFAHG